MGLNSKIQKLKMIIKMPKGFLINSIIRTSIFYKNSSASANENDVASVCSEMRIMTHTIEKGMSLPNVRRGFGKEKVQRILELIDIYISINDFTFDYDAFLSALGMVCRYIKESEKYGLDISFIDINKYEKWMDKVTLHNYGTKELVVYECIDKLNFEDFALARHSVRKFSEDKLSIERIKKAVNLAQTAPSACNRQATKIIYVSDREKCKKILEIQGGAKGHSLTDLLLIVSDLSLYSYLSEMDTPYLDGGIFLMNLLYACTYYGIATCPLIWDDYGEKGCKLRKVISLKQSMHVVAIVQIGEFEEKCVYAISHKRPLDDIFIEI